MNALWRLTILALICGVSGPLAGCAVRGSSFETLGVPSPEYRSGRSPVILGWAREDRSGWAIRRVRVDGSRRNEFDPDTQQPAVIYLRPGEHEIALDAAQLRDPEDFSSRPRRRYRVRPFEVELLEDEAQMCVIRLGGDRRRRPRVRCEAYAYGEEEEEDEYGDEYDDEYDDEYSDEYSDEDEYADAEDEMEPEREPEREPAPPTQQADAGDPEGVPSPFGATPTTPPARPPEPEPAPTPPPAATPPAAPAPTPTPPASSRPAPRRLSLEERIERLERQLEQLRREVRED